MSKAHTARHQKQYHQELVEVNCNVKYILDAISIKNRTNLYEQPLSCYDLMFLFSYYAAKQVHADFKLVYTRSD